LKFYEDKRKDHNMFSLNKKQRVDNVVEMLILGKSKPEGSKRARKIDNWQVGIILIVIINNTDCDEVFTDKKKVKSQKTVAHGERRIGICSVFLSQFL